MRRLLNHHAEHIDFSRLHALTDLYSSTSPPTLKRSIDRRLAAMPVTLGGRRSACPTSPQNQGLSTPFPPNPHPIPTTTGRILHDRTITPGSDSLVIDYGRGLLGFGASPRPAQAASGWPPTHLAGAVDLDANHRQKGNVLPPTNRRRSVNHCPATRWVMIGGIV